MKHPIEGSLSNVSLHLGDISPVESHHTGTDFVGSNLTVFAIRKGIVLFAGIDPDFPQRGGGVKIAHPWLDDQWTFIVRYWHLRNITVNSGDHVDEGQILGWTTDHLHLDIQIPDNGQGNSKLKTDPGYRFTDPPVFLEQLRLGEREKELTRWLNDTNQKKEHWKKWCREWELTVKKHGINQPEFKCSSFDHCEEV